MKTFIQALTILLLVFVSTSAYAKALSDAEITRRVEKLLVEENDIPNTNISVMTNKGVVELSGDVDTSLQTSRVIELASSIKSVVDVNTDKLVIRSSREFLTDAYITAKTKGKIKYLALNGLIEEGYKLHVETTNKVVHIFGDVHDKKDIETIKDAIEDIIDVADVKMNITCH